MVDSPTPSEHEQLRGELKRIRAEKAARDAARAAAAASMLPQADTRTQKATGIVAIIAALGGGAGITQILRPPDLNAARLDDIRQQQREIARDVREIRDYIKASDPAQEGRWAITASTLCRLNQGKPFARGVNCDAVPFEVAPLSAGETITPPRVHRAIADWPRLPTP